MKNIILVFTFLITYSGFSQVSDSTKIKVETPKIISKLMYGKTIEVEDLEFKFVTVESDSRCPKGVQCVWAGEAIVLIDVFKNGKLLEQKRVAFSPTAQLQNLLGNLFASEGLNVSGLNIEPYPEYRNKIDPKDYYITLDVRE